MLTCIPTVYNGVAPFELTGEKPEISAEEKPEISAEEITKIVSVSLDISLSDMRSETRKRPVVEARQIAMHLIRKHTDETLVNIGKMFGNRDHSTVIYSCQTVEDLRQTNKIFKQLISKLNRKIYEN